MAAHLWTGEPPPKEYVILYLCRLYHCTPSQLAKEDPAMILAHLTCAKWEQEVANTEALANQKATDNDRLHYPIGG